MGSNLPCRIPSSVFFPKPPPPPPPPPSSRQKRPLGSSLPSRIPSSFFFPPPPPFVESPKELAHRQTSFMNKLSSVKRAMSFKSSLVENVVRFVFPQFKSKMQIQIIRAKSGEPVMYRNVFHAAYVIVKTHGIRGAYQGLPATWLRNIPANSAFFGELHGSIKQVQTAFFNFES